MMARFSNHPHPDSSPVSPAVLRRGLVGVTLGCWLACVVSVVGEDGSVRADESTEQARTWIDQLAAPAYSTRERATQSLIDYGIDVLPELERAFGSADREVRDRAKSIAQEILRRERPRRLARFLSGDPVSSRFPLPGWRQLEALAGDSPQSRQFLVDLLISNWELLEPRDSSVDRTRLFRDRCHELTQRSRTGLSTEEQRTLAAILLASLDDSMTVPLDATSTVRIYTLVRVHSLRGQRDEQSIWNNDVYQRIVSRFLLHTTNPTTAHMALQIALQHGLPELTELAELNLEHAGMPATAKQWSVLVLGQHGSEEHIDVIEPFLQDEQVCTRRNVPGGTESLSFECRVQDAALLALWILHDQDIAELGFVGLSTNPRLGYLPQTVGFATEQERSDAMAKYYRLKVHTTSASDTEYQQRDSSTSDLKTK